MAFSATAVEVGWVPNRSDTVQLKRVRGLVEAHGSVSFRVFGKTNQKQMFRVAEMLRAKGFKVETGTLGDRPTYEAADSTPRYSGRIGRMWVERDE
jgi:hypothetical protein